MNAELVRVTLERHAPELRDDYGVASLLLFGSIARGDGRADSDVDLLVEFGRPTGYFGLVALQDYLAMLLGRTVDLGTLRSLKPRVRVAIESDIQRVF